MNNKPSLHTVLSPKLLEIYDVSDSIVVILTSPLFQKVENNPLYPL
jgi:hypothetical protein